MKLLDDLREEFPIDDSLILGLDIGIASCGSAVLSTSKDSPIEFLGVRCFEAAEVPKTREPKSKERRDARGLRRVIRRRRHRMAEIRRLFVAHDLLKTPSPEDLKQKGKPMPCPWELRTMGLDRELNPEEFARALLHIAKRRGFKSNKKSDGGENAPPDGKRMLAGVESLKEKAQAWRTVGEMMFRDSAFSNTKRNKSDDYSHTVSRSLLESEVEILFRSQRRLGNILATEELEAAFRDIAFFQRPLQDSEDMVGMCPFETDEKRAAQCAYSFELFRFLSRLNTLTIRHADGTTGRLTPKQLSAAAKNFGDETKTGKITFKTLRKKIELSSDATFVGVDDKAEKKDVSTSKGAARGTATLRQVLGAAGWNSLVGAPEILDKIAFVLSFREDYGRIEEGLSGLALDPLILSTLMDAVRKGTFSWFTKAGHISAKAARAMVPHLLRGMTYDKACAMARYDHTDQLAIDIDQINSPVVRRTLREAIRQVAVLVREFGARPGRIHVEMARAVGKSPDERGKLRRGIEDRTSAKEKARETFKELLGQDTCSDDELLKYELWVEQGKRCIYTDQGISPRSLVDGSNAVQVDHALPRSRSQDNSYINKVLCTAQANQDKKNRTPWEWRGETDPQWWAEFQTRVEKLPIKGRKKRNLLMKNFDDEVAKRFRERNLQDTKYAARALRRALEQLYADEDGATRRLFTRPGALTAMVRRAWGLKKSRDDDSHHATDALVVAAMGEGLANRLARLYQRMEAQGLQDRTPNLEPPWPTFRDEALAALANVFVVRTETRRARGKGHEATIRRVRDEDGKRIVYERKRIHDLKIKDLERIKNPERNGAIIDSLTAWIDAKKPKDAPPLDGQGAAISRVRLRQGEKAGQTVRGGHADNSEIIRTDVFGKDGKFYLVPIYRHQWADKSLPIPNLAIDANTREKDWTRIDSSFDFRFSLYPDSFVEVVKRNGEYIDGYFRGADRSTGAITLSPHNHRPQQYLQRGIGVRTLGSLKKFQIDRLGRKFEIKWEKRTWHGVACT
ncbi:MAG TPA: type II CRISPR RNA-guided endonuclease Cas9 [Rhodospirillales bacterium]|nr:type II CRISPR RNA-guided endonuclease Cas9 [Rhodospirillales bacterium]